MFSHSTREAQAPGHSDKGLHIMQAISQILGVPLFTVNNYFDSALQTLPSRDMSDFR